MIGYITMFLYKKKQNWKKQRLFFLFLIDCTQHCWNKITAAASVFSGAWEVRMIAGEGIFLFPEKNRSEIICGYKNEEVYVYRIYVNAAGKWEDCLLNNIIINKLL